MNLREKKIWKSIIYFMLRCIYYQVLTYKNDNLKSWNWKKNYVLDTTPLIRRDISKSSIIDQFKDISKCTRKSYSITYIQSVIDMMIRYIEVYVPSLMIEIIYINIDVQVNEYIISSTSTPFKHTELIISLTYFLTFHMLHQNQHVHIQCRLIVSIIFSYCLLCSYVHEFMVSTISTDSFLNYYNFKRNIFFHRSTNKKWICNFI